MPVLRVCQNAHWIQRAGSDNGRDGGGHASFHSGFRNRLDAIVQFGALNEEVIEQVVHKFIAELQAQLDDRKVSIELDESAMRWRKRGYDKAMGARPMARLIQDSIKRPLADAILFGELAGGGSVLVTADKNELAFEMTPRVVKSKKLREVWTSPSLRDGERSTCRKVIRPLVRS